MANVDFRIADTFTDSLARLTGEEQKAAKTTAFDLQLDPSRPGMQFHKLDRAKDARFWSVRVSRDIRLIVHRSESSLLLCYVGHHDAAYAWAERRRVETHPRTGAAQLVELQETVREVEVPVYVVRDTVPAPLFEHVADSELLDYGVPRDWLSRVREANEDTILEIALHLPDEAAEVLVALATGQTPQLPIKWIGPEADPFEHPDAQRRFRTIENEDELRAALDFPWDRWTVFLHPAQRDTVEREYVGPARVSGTAGTGKTIVALHRAVHLARTNPDARVLLTTFSGALANALRVRLRRLLLSQPRLGERIDVEALDSVALRLHRAQLGEPQFVDAEDVRAWLEQARDEADASFGLPFLITEWQEVVDGWQLVDWEAYRDVARLGRRTRLPEKQRAVLWQIFELVRQRIAEAGRITHNGMLATLTEHFARSHRSPYDVIVVDEAQDISVAQLRLVAALAADRPNGLFFAGDLGQRIFRQPFSWKSQGVNLTGRSRTLRVNYRTSHQIRSQADRLLAPQLADADGHIEDRRGAVSVFNGPAPRIVSFDGEAEEVAGVGEWLRERAGDGIAPDEMAVFVRSPAEIARAEAAVRAAGLECNLLDERLDSRAGHVAVGTMHLAKGLEYRAVAVMACDDEVIPLASRIESITDEADLEDVFNTERQLLYVACTRARDQLSVTAAGHSSEFLEDLQ